MPNPALIPDKLYKELMDLIEKGDEKALRKYLIAHLEELPKAARDAIIMQFIEEAINKRTEEAARTEEFQKKSFQAIEDLDHAQEEAEKRKKLLEIKKDI